MKLIILSIFVISLAIDTRSGVVQDIFGKMKNTTNHIKDDVKGWLSSGKDLVFGEHNHEEAKETEHNPECHHEDGEGIIKGLVRKVHDKVDHVKEKIHNIFAGNTENNIHVESTTTQINVVGASVKVDLPNKKDENNITNGEHPTNPIQNPQKDSVDSDENFNFNIDVRDSFSKTNEAAQNAKKDIDMARDNLQSDVSKVKEELERKTKDIQDRTEEMLNKVSSNIKSSRDTLEKQSNSFTDDLKKQF